MLTLDRSLVTDLVDEHITICRDAVNSHMDAERMPYTQNNHYLQTAKNKWLSRYKADRAADQGSSTTTTKTAPAATASFKLFNNPPQTANGATPSKKGFSPSGGAVNAFSSITPQSGTAFASTPQPFSFGNGSSSTTPTPSSSTTPTPVASAGQSQSPAPLSGEKEEKMRQAIALLTSAGYEGLKVEDLGKLHPPDIYEREMDVMAEVRGYFQVSYKVRTEPPFFSPGG